MNLDEPEHVSRVSDVALARLLARDEIRQLAYRYAWLLDSRDINGLANLFVPDVRVGPDATGRAALDATFSAQLRDLGPTTLFVGNHIVDFDAPHTATGIVYCRGYIQDPDGFIEQMIVYRDEYRHCDDDGWRFVRRRHELFYGIRTAEQPHDLPPANWPEHQTGVGSLPFALESWQSFHAEPRG